MDLTRIAMPVCRDCLTAVRKTSSLRHRTATATATAWLPRQQPTTRRAVSMQPRCSDVRLNPQQKDRSSQDLYLQQRRSYAARPAQTRPPTPPTGLDAMQYRALELTNTLLHPTSIALPSEQRILYVLEQLEMMVKTMNSGPTSKESSQPARSRDTTATSALLGSVNSHGKRTSPVTKQSILDLISTKAEEIALHPFIFLTPSIIKTYVDLQCALNRPESFPEVFRLYATKPIPKASGNAVTYSDASPTAANAAINPDVANKALETAILMHDLPLCTAIIEHTFATPAHKKSKLIKQALLPGLGLSLAPVAAYTLSQQFSHLQSSALPPESATGIAFAGIMTYVAAVSSMGYIAVTTANDQMDRITWAQGVPLWERWVREEERASVDAVAGAWGFEDREKRGDEEGGEWESLREWVGRRGMVLDAVELMEGME